MWKIYLSSDRHWWSSSRSARRAAKRTSLARERVSFSEVNFSANGLTAFAATARGFRSHLYIPAFSRILLTDDPLQYSPWGILSPPRGEVPRANIQQLFLSDVSSSLRVRRYDSRSTRPVIYHYVKYEMYLVKRWIMISDDRGSGQIVADKLLRTCMNLRMLRSKR